MRRYILYPDIFNNRITFVSGDDIWLGDLECGGHAWRLTDGFCVPTYPRFSPDGKYIAFTGITGGEEQFSDVYVMTAEGEGIRRVTYTASGQTKVVGWTPDGRIVFATDRWSPFPRWTELCIVHPYGGPVERLPVGPASSLVFGPRKMILLGRNTEDLPNWKRYKGGAKGVLWVSRRGDWNFEKFLELGGHITSPMWVGDRVYFLCDHEGVGNLYSIDVEGGGIRRHTNNTVWYARNASTDGKRIVFHAGGDLYLYDAATGLVRRLEFELTGSGRTTAPFFAATDKYLEEAVLDDEGRRLLVTVRGKTSIMDVSSGLVFNIIEQGARHRLSRFLASNRVISLCDGSGEEEFEVRDIITGEVKRYPIATGQIEVVEASPNGKFVAATTDRMELLIMDLESGATRVLDKSGFGRIEDIAWSPDSTMIAYSFPEGFNSTSIKLVNVTSDETIRVTSSYGKDYSPTFDPEGRYLYYLSKRTLDPVYDNVVFDLGFPKAVKPFICPLKRDISTPFVPQFSYTLRGVDQLNSDKQLGMPAAFPVEEDYYTKIAAIKGKVLLLTFPIEGAKKYWMTGQDKRSNGTLKVFDLDKKSFEVFATNVSDMVTSRSGEVVLIRSGNQLRTVSAKDVSLANKKDGDGPTGTVDLGRVKVLIDPYLEWRQMFREAWRLMRDNFWDKNLGGVNWEEVYKKYSELLPRITTRFELSDLIREMQGEVGSSHTYERNVNYSAVEGYPVGGFGAVFEGASEGYIVSHLFVGDTSNEGERSPLADIGVKQGDIITEINGVKLDSYTTPDMALLNRAGDVVIIRVKSGSTDRIISVKALTLKDERQLIYRAWVENNREFVHMKSGGRVGYVHIPNMGPWGFAEFTRLYPIEAERGAVIIDVRYNGGGHISPLILEKLLRRRIGYSKPRWGKPQPRLPDSVNGPIVCLTNERAGSDGDIFSHVFKLLGIGPLIGTRTWGGVRGINPRRKLVDGSVVTQPVRAAWFSDVGYSLENMGAEPDVFIENTPQDYASKRDSQLEKAVEVALQLLSGWKPLNEPE